MNTLNFGGRYALAALLLQSTALLVQPVAIAHAATQSQIVFDIPAGSLSSVITAIAATAHEQIAFSSDLVAPFQAGPIHGRKSVRAALSEALRGTGLSVVLGTGGALAVRGEAVKTKAAGVATDIADIDVTGNGSGLHDDGFQAGDSGASLRLGDTQIKEVPRSIGVVTKKVLDTQGITSATDAVTNISGVTVASAGAATPIFTIRGFENSTGYYVNGLGAASYGALPIDDVERVEVLKGPTSIMTGTTAEGGAVNISTKRPTDQTIRDVTVRLGSFGYKTLAFDLGGLVPQTEGLTYRFNISGNTADKNYAGYRSPHEHLISPALQWQDHDTTVLLGLRYVDARILPNQYTFVPSSNASATNPILAVTRGVNEINPELHVNTKAITLYNDASHDFGKFLGADVTVNNHFQYIHEAVSAVTYSWNTTGGTNNLYRARQYYTRFNLDKLTDRSDVTIKNDFGFAQQMSKFGFDFTQSKSITDSNSGALITTANPYSGSDFNLLYSNIDSNTYDTLYKSVDAGFYYLEKFDTFNNRLHILGQVREDHFKTQNTYGYFYSAKSTLSPGQNGLSWTAGGAFDVTPWFTAYGNRSNGYYPSNGFNSTTHAVLPPEHRDQSEVGGRFFFFNKRLTLTPAFYTLAATNVSIKDPSDPTGLSYTTVGGLQSRGFEFDAQGQITDAVAVIASFADVHTAYSTTSYSFTMPGVPQYTASLWATYTVEDGFARGITFGFGAHGNTGSIIESATTANSFYKMPGYVVEDMMVGYEHDRYSISLKINNLGNKYYFLPTYSSAPITIAQGRNALLTMKYSF